MGTPLPGTKLQPQSKVLIDISHRGLHGRCGRGGWQSRKQQGTKITGSMRAILRNELTDASDFIAVCCLNEGNESFH